VENFALLDNRHPLTPSGRAIDRGNPFGVGSARDVTNRTDIESVARLKNRSCIECTQCRPLSAATGLISRGECFALLPKISRYSDPFGQRFLRDAK